MTNKNMYCIYDTVAKESSAPFLANNHAHAHVIFDRSVSQAEKEGFKQEYKLLFIGFIDIDTGSVSVARNGAVVTGIPEDVSFDLKAEDDD